MLLVSFSFAQDWNGIIVPPSPGAGKIWDLQTDVSDDFNYEAPASVGVDTLGGKWINWYHNGWSGPKPTVWKRDYVFVEDGNFKVIASRPAGDTVIVDGQKLGVTNLGCAHSLHQVQYPVFVEANVKIMNSVLASDVWMLSSDDTQEIDVCEAYGSERWDNSYFSDKRLHLSHHVLIQQPSFIDWQPSDAGSFYTNDTTVWREDYHRIGVYWIDPWNLKYYVDGELVRQRSGPDEIDPVYHTNAINPGDVTNDTRTGLSKPMDIIINTEDQGWRALQGLTPTDDELANTDDNTFQVDWIRVYKPIDGMVDPVSSVSIDPSEVTTYVGNEIPLTAMIVPYNAQDLSVVWESDNPTIASINQDGLVETLAEGVAQIIVTTNENNKKDTCLVTVTGISPSLNFDNEFVYLNTNYQVGGNLNVTCDFHAGTGNTVIDGGNGGVKFWLREIAPGWSVVNDYVSSDPSVVGLESGTATGTISLIDVPAVSEIPNENWYFLYTTFQNSSGDFLDTGIYPINIVDLTSVNAPVFKQLETYPNPAQSVLHINKEAIEGDFTIQLIYPSGKMMEVIDFDNSANTIQLDISNLPKGFYMLRLVSEEVYVAGFVKR